METPFRGLLGGQVNKIVENIIEGQRRVAAELQQTTVEGSAGGGAVRVKATGSGHVLDVEIAPEVVDPADVQILQDLVVAAVREALRKASELASEKRREALGPWASFLGEAGLT